MKNEMRILQIIRIILLIMTLMFLLASMIMLYVFITCIIERINNGAGLLFADVEISGFLFIVTGLIAAIFLFIIKHIKVLEPKQNSEVNRNDQC
ncbi:MAG: hypothetical protein V1720_17165 [bacterium]